jgi:hypothetical protein
MGLGHGGQVGIEKVDKKATPVDKRRSEFVRQEGNSHLNLVFFLEKTQFSSITL